MKYSHLFTKTSKEVPADESSKGSQYLVRAGFIQRVVAGAYSFLPLGLRTLNKIENIVREEMNKADGVEFLMPSLVNKSAWDKTERWDMDVLYKSDLGNGKEMGFAPTHEETITPIIQSFATSPKDFPLCAYQFQWKFRKEPRAKSGLLRGREFLMKDAYSFHTSKEDFEKYYETQKQAYIKIYERLGLGDITHYVAADGGDFSEFSHEFQTESEIGEDTIFIHPETGEYFNQEIVSEEDQKNWKNFKAVEVGNIFPLENKFSKAFSFKSEGKEILMGCYGIGISRVMGVMAEIFSDEKGLIWPKNIAPFQVYLAPIGKNSDIYDKALEIYKTLQENNIEVLLDDRQGKKIGPGVKFGDAELMGIPTRIVLSEKLLEDNNLEVLDRKTGEVEIISIENILEFLKQ